MNLGLFYDTETTGLPDWKNPSEEESQPHLVQLAALLADMDEKKIIQSMDVIIKPDGWEIPDEVSEVHGITSELAEMVGIPEEQALDMFLSLWDGRDRISHNKTFDQRIIRIATKRYCDEEIIEAWADKDSHHCTMLQAKPIMQLLPMNRYGFKSPRLSEAYKFFTGNELENAHTAMADAQACLEIYFAMKERGE
jgi:DNA polymerase-3 subunit epsilon